MAKPMKLELELTERQTALLQVRADQMDTGLIGAATNILEIDLAHVEAELGAKETLELTEKLRKASPEEKVQVAAILSKG